MSSEKPFDVFLSHSSVDKSWVVKLKNALQTRGLRVWLDRDEIRPGDLFVNALESGLNESKVVALIVSPQSLQSGWVKEEYSRAVKLAQDHKSPLRLIPVILRTAELPGFLGNRNWVDFRDESKFEENLQQLIWGITGAKPGASDSPKTLPHAFRPVRVVGDKIQYADAAGGELADIRDLFPRQAQPDILDGECGLFECVAGSGQGKTTFGYQLIYRALEKGHHVFWHKAEPLSKKIDWPPDLEDSRSLLVLDNAHHLEQKDIWHLAGSLPKGVSALALSRSVAFAVECPSTCCSVKLNDHDLREYVLNFNLAKTVARHCGNSLLKRIAGEVLTWEEAATVLRGFALNPREKEKTLNQAGSFAEFVKDTTRRELDHDGVRNIKVLRDFAAFNFLELKMEAGEIKTGNPNLEKLIKTGWVDSIRHPKSAERVLRALDLLGPKNGSRRVGQILADVMIRSAASPVRVQQVRLQVRYGTSYSNLPDSQDLLAAFYERLLDRRREYKIRPDDLHTDYGSELRRIGRLDSAVQQLKKVGRKFRSTSSRWRYERAYVPFMRGTPKDLTEAGRILSRDIEGNLDGGRFINRGLYTKILARQGRLQEAYNSSGSLVAQALQDPNEDVRRWVLANVPAHRHQFATGLFAHGMLLRNDLDKRYEDLKRDSREFNPSWFYFNEALHSAVTGDANATKDKAQASLAVPLNEQRASHLALLGAAYEVLRERGQAEKAYREIRGLQAKLDNSRGIDWERRRQVRVGEEVSPALLTEVVRTLYPLVVPVTKELLHKPKAPSGPSVREMTLDQLTYEQILQIIHDTGVSYERYPSTFAKLGEEAIRNLLISALSTAFDGSTTAESFNRTGKTDILIRRKNSNVFVGECKFWGGQRKHHETIDQILSYLTWRDSMAAIIYFVRAKDMTKPRETIAQKTPEHRCFVTEKEVAEKSRFSYEFRLPRQPATTVQLAVLCFHMPKV